MPEQPWIWTFDRTIPSDPDVCAGIMEELLEVLQDNGWSERDLFAIRMALEEAIQNAIRHGNECQRNKSVEIEIRLAADSLIATIVDQGIGFDREAVPDPTLEANLDRCSGRGLMLIENYVDEVVFNEAGNSVTLHKHKSIDDSTSAEASSL